jgi:hypothetical protein
LGDIFCDFIFHAQFNVSDYSTFCRCSALLSLMSSGVDVSRFSIATMDALKLDVSIYFRLGNGTRVGYFRLWVRLIAWQGYHDSELMEKEGWFLRKPPYIFGYVSCRRAPH